MMMGCQLNASSEKKTETPSPRVRCSLVFPPFHKEKNNVINFESVRFTNHPRQHSLSLNTISPPSVTYNTRIVVRIALVQVGTMKCRCL
jgi:hypothetical protein